MWRRCSQILTPPFDLRSHDLRYCLLAVPRDGALQALLKTDLWLVAEMFLRQRDVGQRVFDIAGAIRAMPGRALVTCQAPEQGIRFVQGHAPVAGDIEELPRDVTRRCAAC